MTEPKTKELEQTENSGIIQGELSEMNIYFSDDKRQKIEGATGNESNVAQVEGSIVVMTSPDNFYEISVFTNKLKSDGTPNPMFEGYKKIVKDYVPRSSGGKGTIVKCYIQVQPNYYYNRNAVLTKSLRLNLRSMNSSTTLQPEDYCAQATIEGAIAKWTPEQQKIGEELKATGRLEVEFAGVGYKGNFLPFQVFVPDDLADGFEGFYEKGNTTTFDINIINRTVGRKTKPKKQASFGRTEEASPETSQSFDIVELEMYKGYDPCTEEYDSAQDALDLDLLAEARKEFDNQLEQKKKEKEAQKNSGATTTSKPSKGLGGKPKLDIADEDVPF